MALHTSAAGQILVLHRQPNGSASSADQLMAKYRLWESLSSANCQAMAHYRRYEAHNHRQRDKYWPTADASLFERRRRAIL